MRGGCHGDAWRMRSGRPSGSGVMFVKREVIDDFNNIKIIMVIMMGIVRIRIRVIVIMIEIMMMITEMIMKEK